MKKQNMYAALSSAIVFILAIVLVVSCQKTPVIQTSNVNETELDSKSQAFIERIKKFKKRMEMYRETPGLKTEQKYYADEAVSEMEDLLNFDFGYGMLQVDKQEIVYSEISMPLDSLLKIGESDLSQFYYQQVIEEIQSQMLSLNGYSNVKLMFVDLKHKETTEDGNAIIGINSFIGNEGTIASGDTESGWWFGFGVGDCEGNYNNGLDAAILLEQDLNKTFNDPPPSGYEWRWKNIVTVGPLEPMDDDFINPDDDVPEDNYEDRLIFYATSEYNDNNVLTNDDKCVSTDAETGWNLEMAFYDSSYSIIGNDVMVENNGNQWNIDIIEFEGNVYNHDIVKHTLKITSSFKYLAPADEVNILDILSYE